MKQVFIFSITDISQMQTIEQAETNSICYFYAGTIKCVNKVEVNNGPYMKLM